MDIEKSNELIAEFMEYEKIIDKVNGFEFVEYNTPFEPYCCVIQLKFHKSWDWLMSVVEKIENFNDGLNLCIIEDETCHIETRNGFNIHSVGETKIEATYKAVIAFIEWYNKSIKNK